MACSLALDLALHVDGDGRETLRDELEPKVVRQHVARKLEGPREERVLEFEADPLRVHRLASRLDARLDGVAVDDLAGRVVPEEVDADRILLRAGPMATEARPISSESMAPTTPAPCV